ncbi:MAG: hypothetical protein ACUVWK_05525 [Nitrososphaerales archaeon]
MTNVSSNIFNWDKHYASAIRRLEKGLSMSSENRAKTLAFLQSGKLKGVMLRVASMPPRSLHFIVPLGTAPFM